MSGVVIVTFKTRNRDLCGYTWPEPCFPLSLSVGPQLFLEEQSFSLREAQRTLRQKVLLYVFRVILNLLVLALLGGAFYLIYFATTVSLYKVRRWC